MQEVIQAIDLALAGDWDQAHKIVQNIENETAYWIHAVRTRSKATGATACTGTRGRERQTSSRWTPPRSCRLFAGGWLANKVHFLRPAGESLAEVFFSRHERGALDTLNVVIYN